MLSEEHLLLGQFTKVYEHFKPSLLEINPQITASL